MSRESFSADVPNAADFRRADGAIVVIGFQKPGPAMYPHLADFLALLRQEFGQVRYLAHDDRGEGLYRFDLLVETIRQRLAQSGRDEAATGGLDRKAGNIWRERALFFVRAYDGLRGLLSFLAGHLMLRARLRICELRYRQVLVVAIDHTAAFAASRSTRSPLVFWSFDALAADAPWLLPQGLLKRLLGCHAERRAALLLVQDAARKRMAEDAVEHRFEDAFFLPVGLQDRDFDREAARRRALKEKLGSLKVIQSGWIAPVRWSPQLVAAYQDWPQGYQLCLHGYLSKEFSAACRIEDAVRQPTLSTTLIPADELPSFLDSFDVGFLGYGETDLNHRHIENASLQLVLFLRLGIPVVCCGPASLCRFVDDSGVGISIAHPSDALAALEKIAGGYGEFSRNSRRLFETRFDLEQCCRPALVERLNALLAHGEGTPNAGPIRPRTP